MGMFFLAYLALSLLTRQAMSLQWSAWSRFSECSVSCGNGLRYQRRDCTVVGSGDGICQGPAEQTKPCIMLACPQEEVCNCGCDLREPSGRVSSVLPYTKPADCEWKIRTRAGTRIKLTIDELRLKNGEVYLTGNEQFLRKISNRQGERPDYPYIVTSTSNVLNISLHSFFGLQADGDIRVDFSYEQIKDEPVKNPDSNNNSSSNLNIPAIAGITACVAIILIASCIVGYRKYGCGSSDGKHGVTDEEVDDSCSSVAGSNRSAHKQQSAQKAKTRLVNEPQISIEQQNLLQQQQQQHGYIQQPTYVMQPYWGAQPMNVDYRLQPQQQGYIMNPAQYPQQQLHV